MKNTKRIFIAVLTLAAMLVSGFVGYALGRPSEAVAADHRLLISAVIDEEGGWSAFTPEELGGNYDNDLLYSGLKEVTVQIGSTSMALENAIRDNLISIEEICAYARIDARNGKCKEIYESENGLAAFTYQYTEFDLRVIYDIYQTPDGKQHLIHSIGLYKPGQAPGLASTVFVDDESEYGYLLDREDWGLTLEAKNTSPTSLTISYVQSGGQHIGQLQAEFFTLFTADGTLVTAKDGSSGDFCDSVSVRNNATSEFTVSWEESHGELPSGEYIMELELCDVYDETQVSELMSNFHDRQAYYIEFTIP